MLDQVANGIEDFVLVVSPDDRYITHYFRVESDIQAEVRFVYQPQRSAWPTRWLALRRSSRMISFSRRAITLSRQSTWGG